MTTLIEVRNSDGVIGRCDAKCYTATNNKCDCICGGKNHGAGLDQAIINTRTMADDWIKDYKQKNNLDDSVNIVFNQTVHRF